MPKTKLRPKKPHEHTTKLNKFRLDMVRLKMTIQGLLDEVTEMIMSESYSRQDQVDLGWIFRELENLCDDMRKDSKARKMNIGKLLAFRLVSETLAEEEDELHVTEDSGRAEGVYATGTATMSMKSPLPKPPTEEYTNLCRFLGVDEDWIESGIVGFRFQNLGKLVTRLTEEGQPLPPGISKTFPEYSMTFRTRKKPLVND